MPDTENSIQETGIPVLEMEVSASQEVQWPVDDTLSIAGEAADAKATGDAIGNIETNISDLDNEIREIQDWTGEDIPLNSSEESIMISELLDNLYPVGAIYSTTAETIPAVVAAIGTWTEVRIPLTWGDIKNGTRSYAEIEEGDEMENGTVHFWLRTE